MISVFMMILGYLMTIVAICLLILYNIEYHNENHVFIFKVFGFGVIKARSNKCKDNLNLLRKTEGKTYFIDCPEWFNKYVYNMGVKE